MTKEELKTDESKHIINLVIKDKLKKEAEEIIQRFEMANSMNYFMQLTPDRKQIGEMLVMIAEPREKRNEELEKENAELKEKLKPENCLKLLAKEGYVKFTSDQLTKAKEIIKTFLAFAEAFGYSPSMDKFISDTEQFISEAEK